MESLVLVVVLVLQSKALYYLILCTISCNNTPYSKTAALLLYVYVNWPSLSQLRLQYSKPRTLSFKGGIEDQ